MLEKREKDPIQPVLPANNLFGVERVVAQITTQQPSHNNRKELMNESFASFNGTVVADINNFADSLEKVRQFENNIDLIMTVDPGLDPKK